MNRFELLLVVVILVEVTGGCVFLYRPAIPTASPPVPAFVQSKGEREDFEELVAGCTTSGKWRQLAETYMAAGFYRVSEACYAHVATLRPKDPNVRFEWGFVLSRMGRLDESNERFREAIDRGHRLPVECWYFIGRNFLRSEKPDEAAKAFTQCRDESYAQVELARLKFRAGAFQGASELISRVLLKFPHDIISNMIKYRSELELGNTDRAAVFRDRLEYAQGRIPTPFDKQWKRLNEAEQRVGYPKRLSMADSEHRSGHHDAAEKLVNEALEIRWGVDATMRRAEIASVRGQTQESVDLRLTIVNRMGPRTRFLISLARGYAELRNRPKTIETLLLAAEAQSTEDLSPIYKRLPELVQRSDNKARWIALERLHAGRAALWKSDLRTAESTLNEALKLDGNSLDIWFAVAETRRRAGKQEPAREAYRRCLEIDRLYGPAHRGLKLLPPKP